MRIGRLDTVVYFLEPLSKNNGYGRVSANGFVPHKRRAENIQKHSKYYSIRFGGADLYDGILRVRKEDFLNKCTKVKINDIQYNINSIIDFDKIYSEVIYKQDT